MVMLLTRLCAFSGAPFKVVLVMKRAKFLFQSLLVMLRLASCVGSCRGCDGLKGGRCAVGLKRREACGVPLVPKV